MLSDQGKRFHARKRFAELAATAPPKERDYVSRAAAAYDTQEEDLITKTRTIIAATKRSLREAEAVLQRR
jgi:glycerate-2-kinase